MTAVQGMGGHAENWDEDFDFQRSRRPRTVLPRASTSTAENWDDDFEVQGQHSPQSHKKEPVFRPNEFNTENWDDDFEDHRQDSPQAPRSGVAKSAAENWDEEFAEANRLVENWDDDLDDAQSSDDDNAFGEKEEDRTVTARSRRVAPLNVSPPPPVPPLPHDLITNTIDYTSLPRSPTTSIFSLPTSIGTTRPGSSAEYSFTSTQAIRPKIHGVPIPSSAHRFAGLPASPPIHRERRRLRKKSRPSHLDNTLIELDDRFPEQLDMMPSRPRTPEHSQPLPDNPIPRTPPNNNGDTSTHSNRTPLLSRIGSVKKWRPGRKRMSTGPQDVAQSEQQMQRSRRSISNDIEVTPRPTSVCAKVQSSPSDGDYPKSNSESGFSRVLGSAGENHLKSEKRVDKISRGLSPPQDRWMNKLNREPSPSPLPLYTASRRPTSMMVSPSDTSRKLRHASSGAVFGVGNNLAAVSKTSFSASVEDLTYRLSRSVSRDRTKKPKKEDAEEARRSLIRGIRRISFGRNTGRNTDHGAKEEDGDNAKKNPKDLEKGRRHTKSKSTITIDIEASNMESERIAADTAPQLPVLSVAVSSMSPSSVHPSPIQTNSKYLLPAVELKSTPGVIQASQSEPAGLLPLPPAPSSEISKFPSSLLLNKVTGSPQQAASLGRSSQPPKSVDPVASSGGKVTRRNSLSDLKIPIRISQAQTGLKRDLGMVREFARSVELLKGLQITYNALVLEIQSILEVTQTRSSTLDPPSRSTSPTSLLAGRRRSRSNATTMPRSSATTQLSNSFREIESRYAVTWECAELLVELGGGSAGGAIPKVPSHASLSSNRIASSNSAPPEMTNRRRKSRERAITLAGDEQKPTLSASPSENVSVSPSSTGDWTAASDKHDLSHRQLVLLKRMLNYSESTSSNVADFPTLIDKLQLSEGKEINRQWRWGEAGGSTITLPSEGSSFHAPYSTEGDKSPRKKRRSSRLGMSAVRDMLRNLKRSVIEQSHQPPSSGSSIGLSDHGHGRRRAKTSTGPDSTKSFRDRESPFPRNYNLTHPRSPYGSSVAGNKSPRRPSLVSIFRFSKHNKSSANSSTSQEKYMEHVRNTPPASSSGGTGSVNFTTEDEGEWDRVDDSTSDLDFHSPRLPSASDESATVRVKSLTKEKEKSPYMHPQEGLPHELVARRGPEASRSSIWEGTWSRGTKLSNVDELAENQTPSRSGQQNKQVMISPKPSLKRIYQERPRLSGTSPLAYRGGQSDSVRSAPPQLVEQTHRHGEIPLDPKQLALTPETIKPLVENAREVHLRCNECVDEMRLLLSLGEATRTEPRFS